MTQMFKCLMITSNVSQKCGENIKVKRNKHTHTIKHTQTQRCCPDTHPRLSDPPTHINPQTHTYIHTPIP